MTRDRPCRPYRLHRPHGFSSAILGLAALLVAGCCTCPPRLPPPPPPDPPPEPVTTEEILSMTREGRTPEEIVDAMRRSRTVYIIDAGDVIKLHERGVDDRVIDHMLRTQAWDRARRSCGCRHAHDAECIRCAHDCPWR